MQLDIQENTTVGELSSQQQALLTLDHLLEKVRQLHIHGDAATSYVRSLLEKGPKKYGPKLLEESSELCEAAKRDDGKQRVVEEIADVVLHLFVLMQGQQVEIEDVAEELIKRRRS